MKWFKYPLMMAALLAAYPAMANVDGGVSESSSTSRYIETGASDKDGTAGIKVHDKAQDNNKKTANNKFSSFKKIDGMANRFYSSGVIDKGDNGVVVAKMYKMKGGIWDWIPFMPDHSGLGRMSFAQAGNQDVWFGDWADVPAGSADGTAGSNYSVYYSGTNPTTNLPTKGTATYSVKGINNHLSKDTAALTGTLKADFANNKLKGDLTRTGLNLGINATIDLETAKFSGGATANGTKGSTSGRFFGDKGSALAGIATFGTNNPLNTAFGGSKQ